MLTKLAEQADNEVDDKAVEFIRNGLFLLLNSDAWIGRTSGFPSMVLPVDAPSFPVPILDLPSAEIPNYKPIVVPPADLRPPPGVKGKPLEGKQPNTKPNTSTTPPKAPEVDYVTYLFLIKRYRFRVKRFCHCR